MFEFLHSLMDTDDTKVYFLLGIIGVLNIVDFFFGFINAKFNKAVVYKSSKTIDGIMRKMKFTIMAILFIPVSVLMPEPIGLGALYVFYFGYIYAELNSILSHLKLSEDGKESEVFLDFINTFFNSTKGDKKDD